MAQINDPLNANVLPNSKKGDMGLVSYVMELVRGSRDARNQNYQAKWDAYERTYRGIWSSADATREGERSKIIAPAITQAIDSTTASIVDAIFSRQQWIDIADEVADQDHSDIARSQAHLLEDFELTNVPDAIAKIVLNGCLYGTGIGKINLIKKRIPVVSSQGSAGPVIDFVERPLVVLQDVPPWEFVIDSQARDQESALFLAHETHVPRNVVRTKQHRGIYRKTANVMGFNTSATPFPGGMPAINPNRTHQDKDGSVWVTEYYGLVPARLVRPHVEVPADRIEGNGMVEVIATLANEAELLRIVLNPYKWRDRPIVSYQHSYVPGKFWGEGIAGKGWNSQRGLDAELRARMDALGLLTSPMMGADITRLPRNPDFRIRPGKVWMTRGRPSEVLEPIILGNIEPSTFNQSSEMERLVQIATGSVEANAPLNVDRRNETASGISMIQSSALKRMRLTMRNIERQLLNPFVRKAMWRLMQFNPERYPADYEFCIKGTMGIVAREFEQAALTGLLSVIPAESPAHGLIVQSIVEMSGTPKRDELVAALKQAMQPDPAQQQAQQQMQQLQMQMLQEELRSKQVENAKTEAEIQLVIAKTEREKINAALEDDRVAVQQANAAAARDKNIIQDRQITVQARKVEVDAKKATQKPTK